MIFQVKKKEKRGVFQDQGRGRAVAFVLYNGVVLQHETDETAHFCLLIRLQQQAK